MRMPIEIKDRIETLAEYSEFSENMRILQSKKLPPEILTLAILKRIKVAKVIGDAENMKSWFGELRKAIESHLMMIEDIKKRIHILVWMEWNFLLLDFEESEFYRKLKEKYQNT